MENLTHNPHTTQQNRKLYWLFGKLGINDKDAIAEIVWDHTEHRTSHTSELSFMECMNLIKWLETTLKERRFSQSEQTDRSTDEAMKKELDRKRKGVIKAIFRWFELRGKQPTMDYVKAVACRAAGTDSFNAISSASLSRIYAEFCNKQRTVEAMRGDDWKVFPN